MQSSTHHALPLDRNVYYFLKLIGPTSRHVPTLLPEAVFFSRHIKNSNAKDSQEKLSQQTKGPFNVNRASAPCTPFLRSIFRGIFLVSHLMLHLLGLILLAGERGHRINITTRMILHVHWSQMLSCAAVDKLHCSGLTNGCFVWYHVIPFIDERMRDIERGVYIWTLAVYLK